MRSLFLILLALGLCVTESLAAGAPSTYEQVPPRTADGGANLTYHWIEGGGARLYWNSVSTPRQVRLAGQTWRDPALVPCLNMAEYKCPPPQKNYRRWAKHKKGKAAKKAQLKKKVAKKNVAQKSTPKPAHTSAKLAPPKLTPPAQVSMQPADPVGTVPPERLQ